MEQPERTWLQWLREAELAAPAGLALFLLATVAAVLGVRLWEDLNDPEPLLSGLPASGARQMSPAPRRIARKVVIVIADGVNAHRSQELASLNTLHQRGVRAEGMAAGPTFSTPSYVTWLTGLDPVDSGIRTNRFHGPVPLDSLIKRAHEAGLKTMAYESGKKPLVGALFGDFLHEQIQGAVSWERALAALDRAELAIVALKECDLTGHKFGASSPQYDQALEQLDRKIQAVLPRLDLDRDILAVINDHGHLPTGGHGGKEEVVRRLFLVMAGPGVVQRHKEAAMDQKDLAPTLALLAGLLPPAHNRGWPLEWALDPALGIHFHRARFLAQLHTRLRVERYLSREILGGVRQRMGQPLAEELSRASVGDLNEARRLGRGRVYSLQRQVDGGRMAYLRSLRIIRGTIWIALLALFAATLFVAGRLKILRVGILPPLAAVLMAGTATWLLEQLGVRASLSVSGGVAVLAVKAGIALGGSALLHLMLTGLLARAAGVGPDGLTGGVLGGAWVALALAAVGHTLIPVAAGAALPDLQVLAAALLAVYGLTIYLTLAGLLLVGVGFLRRGRRRARGPGLPP